MRNVLILGLVFGVVGLAIGYLIFARAPLTGELFPIADLIQPPDSILGEFVSEWRQLTEIRRNILLTAGGGVVVGIVLGVVVSRR